jgi:hypothetical protein
VSLVIFRAKCHRYEFFSRIAHFLLCFWDDFLSFVHTKIEYGALSALVASLTNCKETVGRRKRYEVDALGAFRARNEELGVFLDIVDNHVVAGDVN